MRKALNDLAALGFDPTYAFGRKEDVQPVDYLVGAAAGRGGLPRSAAMYTFDSVEKNDGQTPHAITVKDAPVNAFWSITVYNADGYLEANDRGVNSYNNFSAQPNEDGSCTIHFGGCDDGRSNCIPITPGWNYAIRMYQPRAEILDGSWSSRRRNRSTEAAAARGWAEINYKISKIKEIKMSEIVEYKPGTPFPGVIGRTLDESSPAWPEPTRAKEGAPNVLFFVLDDVGYGQLSPFGGLVNTPTLDKLAQRGLRYTNFNTTALCSPTRGCTLTGRNHHTLGLSAVTELSIGYPAHNGYMGFEHGFLSETLLEQGYNTFAVGKWHLAPPEEVTTAGPFHRWPLGRGFERYYGFLAGDTDQYFPDLVYDNHPVSATQNARGRLSPEY